MKLLVPLCCVLFASIHSSIAKDEPSPFDRASKPAIFKEEVTAILVKAQDGDPNAQFRIGKLYEDGEFFRRDMPKAKEWYQKAKKAGHYGATDSLKRLADREIFDAVERGSLADGREECVSTSIIAHGYSPPVFDSTKHVLHFGAFLGEYFFVINRLFTTFPGRNAGSDSLVEQGISQPARIISPIGKQALGLWQMVQ